MSRERRLVALDHTAIRSGIRIVGAEVILGVGTVRGPVAIPSAVVRTVELGAHVITGRSRNS